MRKYEATGEEGMWDEMGHLAIDPGNRILLGAGSGGLVCWNLKTGASRLHCVNACIYLHLEL
jgi:hypothetical protein